MLVKKCFRIVKSGGMGALSAKAAARIKYKLRAALYTEESRVSREELKRQGTAVYPRDILLSIVVPLYNTPEEYLCQMIESVINQSYKNWELCLVDAGSSAAAGKTVKRYADKRIKYKRLDKNYGISVNTNLAVEMAQGEYVGLLDHDDVLAPNLLFEYRKRIDRGADFIYCDEASFTDNIEKPSVIHFKPDFSPYNLRGNNYICHFSMFKRSLFDEVGGLREGFEGSQDHDLILRLTERAQSIAHVRKVLYYWRIHKNSVAMDISAKPYCINSGVLAVSQQLLRLKIEGSVEDIGSGAAVYLCKYKVRGRGSCRIVRRCENKAAEGCEADFIAVVPRDIILSREDICTLIGIANLEGVGAAGGIGIYHSKVTGGAVRFDGEDCMEIAFDGENIKSGGYMQRLCYTQNVNALNLFAVIPRTAFEQLGGFDEGLNPKERLIDLCLRLRAEGYDVLLNPLVRAKVMPIQPDITERFAAKHGDRLKIEDEYITNSLADYIL